jgi:hypothetical protein
MRRKLSWSESSQLQAARRERPEAESQAVLKTYADIAEKCTFYVSAPVQLEPSPAVQQ